MKTLVEMKDFGKDHWSLLGYIVTRGMDCRGVLNVQHLRVQGDAYPTMVKSGTVPNHSDYDCLNDLEQSGLIVIKSAGVNTAVEITKNGWEAVKKLQIHKANGGKFSEFSFTIQDLLESYA